MLERIIESVHFRLLFKFQVLEEDRNCYHVLLRYKESSIEVMYSVDIQDPDVLILNEFHVDGEGANSIGKEIFQIARFFGKKLANQFNARLVLVKGGRRTTGGNPGRVPKPVILYPR